jgi:hypothetical protein
MPMRSATAPTEVIKPAIALPGRPHFRASGGSTKQNPRTQTSDRAKTGSAAHEVWKAGSSVDDCMKITGHKTSSMFKRYADLFSDEEKSAQQRAVQSKRREWKKAQADTVVAMPKRAAIQ